MIINHTDPEYIKKRKELGAEKYNGAFYYSREICDLIIPRVKTTRSWLTVNVPGKAEDGAIVFIHQNQCPEIYNWLRDYKDLVLVCGMPQTVEKVKHLGAAIYLPLSIDTEETRKHARKKKTKVAAFAGREAKMARYSFPRGTEALGGLPRGKFLDELAKYKKIYAVGRTAIEARALATGEPVTILGYDPRFPDPELWQILDSRDAAKILQQKLDEIEEGKWKK